MKITRLILLYTLVFNCFFALIANAAIVEFPINELLNVQPKEKTNTVVLDLGIIYPNGCYKPETVVNFDDLENHQIFLFHTAEKNQGPCTMAIVKTAIVLEMPIPGMGTFTLIDYVTKQTLGKIVVTQDMTASVFTCTEFCN